MNRKVLELMTPIFEKYNTLVKYKHNDIEEAKRCSDKADQVIELAKRIRCVDGKDVELVEIMTLMIDFFSCGLATMYQFYNGRPIGGKEEMLNRVHEEVAGIGKGGSS